MKNIYLYISLFCATACLAQTKLIGHKSHSGSRATFNTALENSLFDISASNFGLPGKEKRFTVDSIILLPNDKAVVVSSEKDVYIHRPNAAISFKPGRDTLYNHPLLTKKHAKDSILRVLQPYEKKHTPVLINYDNDKSKKNSFFAVPGNDNFPNKPMMVFALALLSGVLGFVSYYFYKVKNAPAAA